MHYIIKTNTSFALTDRGDIAENIMEALNAIIFKKAAWVSFMLRDVSNNKIPLYPLITRYKGFTPFWVSFMLRDVSYDCGKRCPY